MILSIYANAGFFGSIASTAIGTSLASKGGGTVYSSDIKKRMSQVNLYLWHMHTNKNYTQNYKFYLKWQENSITKSGYDDIGFLDTIAWVYKDNGNKKKAIEIYETRILPWVDIWHYDVEHGKTKEWRDKWIGYYNAIKK